VSSKKRSIAVIPARYASSRFPGKPLVCLLNKPMLQHTYENTCRNTRLDEVWIATDDERIGECARSFGAEVMMTPSSCSSGTERLFYALQGRDDLDPDTIIVNVQGDEPLVDPSVIDQIIDGLEHSDLPMATAATLLTHEQDYLSRAVVKCVTDRQGSAIYFSRSPLGSWSACCGERPSVRRHLGIYAYRRWFLEKYAKMEPTPLQQAEDLEQLRVLEHGYGIQVVETTHVSIGVDLPEHVAAVENLLRMQQKKAPLGS
jgi:3-deoxy-manno-octulosonate cytidylyltransferase (CMP-KDO synthetase)